MLVSFTTRRYFSFDWLALNFSLLQMRCSWPLLPLFCLVHFFAFCGSILSVLYSVFTLYSLNLFPNNDNKKTMRCYQKLFCNLYKFVWKSINSIKMDGNHCCHLCFYWCICKMNICLCTVKKFTIPSTLLCLNMLLILNIFL